MLSAPVVTVGEALGRLTTVAVGPMVECLNRLRYVKRKEKGKQKNLRRRRNPSCITKTFSPSLNNIESNSFPWP